MMYYSDNVNVKLTLSGFGERTDKIRLRQLTNWLRGRNIKYTLVYIPQWDTHPAAINMRTEDAVLFRLVHNL